MSVGALPLLGSALVCCEPSTVRAAPLALGATGQGAGCREGMEARAPRIFAEMVMTGAAPAIAPAASPLATPPPDGRLVGRSSSGRESERSSNAPPIFAINQRLLFLNR